MPEKTCFVIMSFDPVYDEVYKSAIEPALRSKKYKCIRADSEAGPGNIPSEIVKNIILADIIVADLSEPNPNVYYELGISHCVGNKTIGIAREGVTLPFDVSPFRVTMYDEDRKGLKLLKYQLENLVDEMQKRSGQHEPNNLPQEAGREFFDQRRKVSQALDGLEAMRDRLNEMRNFLDIQPEKHDNSHAAEALCTQIRFVLRASSKPFLVSISGPGAIGKSTFAQLVREKLVQDRDSPYSATVVPTDCYQMERDERIAKNLIGFDPKAHDLETMAQDIETLLGGGEIRIRPYDHSRGKHGNERIAKSSDVIILEGVHAFAPLLFPLRGLRVFIDATEHEAKQLKFIADIRERGYDPFEAFTHSDAEYQAYEKHVRPMLRFSDFVLPMKAYWKYGDLHPHKLHPPRVDLS